VTFAKEDATSDQLPESVGVVRAGNIVEGELQADDLVFVPATKVAEKQILRRHDVLIATSSGSLDVVGKAARVREDQAVAFGAFCKVLRPSNRIDPGYFAHYFQTIEYRRHVSSVAAGANINNLKNADLDDIEIPLPSIEEQRRLASILDAADALRTKRRRALAKLDTLTQAIFIDMFGDFDANTLRWSAVELGNIVSESRLGLVRGAGELDDEHPIPYIRMNAIGSNGELDLANVRRTLAAAAEIKSGRLEPGDLLFNTRNSRELVGKTAIFRGNGTFVFNNNILRLRFTTEANPEYVNAAIRQPIVQRSLEVRKAGTTNVFAIYFKDLATVQMPLPPIDLQREFAGRIEALRNLVVPLETSATALDMVFAALQHRAFRGDL
jgi:type I restriction enzyme S subunit